MAAPTNTKNYLDLTREIAQIRNSKEGGANWLASALQKIHDAVRSLQKNA